MQVVKDILTRWYDSESSSQSFLVKRCLDTEEERKRERLEGIIYLILSAVPYETDRMILKRFFSFFLFFLYVLRKFAQRSGENSRGWEHDWTRKEQTHCCGF